VGELLAVTIILKERRVKHIIRGAIGSGCQRLGQAT
jgi:hypothetical protein